MTKACEIWMSCQRTGETKKQGPSESITHRNTHAFSRYGFGFTITVKLSNFMGTFFCGLTMMDMFVNT